MSRARKMSVIRLFTLMMLPIATAGCAGGGGTAGSGFARLGGSSQYAELNDGRYTVPAIDLSEIAPEMIRQPVDYRSSEPAGTIVVDTAARHLYFIEGEGRAVRYGIGVGKAGLAFQGNATIKRKAEWPHWAPTESMMDREPKRYKKWVKGMDGGLENPLGARAMYLYQGDKDTMFRIHGTTEPETIGHAVSSGCIRLMNQDVIDLYSRVKIGTRVVVKQQPNQVANGE